MPNITLVTFPYLGETHNAEKVDHIKVQATIVSDTKIVFPNYDDPKKFHYTSDRRIQLQFVAVMKDFVENKEGELEEQYTEKLVQYETLNEHELETKTQVLDSFEPFKHLSELSDKRTRRFVKALKNVTILTGKKAQSLGINIGFDVAPDSNENKNRGLSGFSLTSGEPAKVEFTDKDKEYLEKAKKRVSDIFNKVGIIEKSFTIPEFLEEFEIEKESQEMILSRIKISLTEFFD